MASLASTVFLQRNFDLVMNGEIEFLDSPEGVNATEHEIQSRIHELEFEFSRFRERHDKLLVAKPQEEATKKYMEENIFTSLRSKYHKVWARLTDKLPKHGSSTEVFSSTIAPSHSKTEVEFEKMKIPTFSGKYDEWMSFNNLFTTSVHNNNNMEDITKLQRLRQCLSGDADLVVRSLQINNANYSVARRLLANRYQHTRRLVNSYLEKIHEFPAFKNETSASLESMLNTLNDCTAALQQLNLPIEDYQLVYIMCRKLPKKIISVWESEQSSSTDLPKYSDFLLFLEKRFRAAEMVEHAEHSHKSFHVSTDKKPLNVPSNTNNESKNKTQSNVSCPSCKGPHYLGFCDAFKKMSQQSRFEFVKTKKICYNCLNANHNTNSCRNQYRCRVCKKPHHSLLHRYTTNNTSNSRNENNSNNNGDANHTFHVNSHHDKGTLLGTAQVRILSPIGISLAVRALVDPCSEDNYILDSTVRTLNLKKIYSPSIIGVLGDDHATECSHRVELFFKSMDDTFSMKISAGVVGKLTSNLPSVHLPIDAFGCIDSLHLADYGFNQPGTIHLLLGVGVYTRILRGEHQRINEDLVAENTLIGHLIRGQVNINADRSSLVLMTHSTTTDLNFQIKKFWEVEEINIKLPLHPDDALCEEIFEESIHQNSHGFLTMDLPFKDNKVPEIGPSRYMAVKRFLSIEKKLNSNTYLRSEYHHTIQNYIDSNHLSKSTSTSENGYYLPHHAVVKDSSTTTKVRVVFDASCRSQDGTSLNDHLLTGRKLQRDIREILFNWRQYPFALTGDIEKMYRMFFINEKHQQYQKIVWRFNENDPIEDYVLKTATFGTSCAPFLAIRCLHYISDLHQSSHPIAATAIKNEFYVDDFLSGGFTKEEALKKQTDVRQILQKYNLSLRKWSSNDSSILSNIPTDLLELSKELAFDETNFRKTLGILWSQHTDSFSFSITSATDFKGTFSKRQILSLIARLYDPLGWVGPCTMLAKQIMQKVWQTNIGWDDTVDSSISNPFQEFLTQLNELKHFSIPRWTNILNSTTPITIFGFSDASDKGYSAVVYLLDPNNRTEKTLKLLTSKTKVADLKFQSIARLELNGALLLSDLLKWTVQVYNPQKVDVKAFCDSKIVLSWLQGHPSKWKTYIANRTSKILDWMDSSQWFYVDTKYNPADCASRGLLPRDLINHDLWINGPNLENLKFKQNYDLNSDQQQTVTEAIKKNSIILHIQQRQPIPLLSQFSKHSKLIKRVTSIIKFIQTILQNLLDKDSQNKEKFTSILKNLENSEFVIFRMLQHQCFHEDIKMLQSKSEVKSTSKLRSLHPFLDGHGILRVGGRLQNSELSFEQKHPIILPKNHQIVINLISDAHEKTLHGSELLTISYLRNRFHIPRIAEKVRNFLHSCITCYKFSKRQQEILMGSLPQERVKFSHPFTNTGVDYAGPLTTKSYPGRCKRFSKSYIAIFICLCTKAIHIELVSDLSSLAFLAAFKRFVSRRGPCSRLFSDNGKNFVGANKILQSDIRIAENSWKTELDVDFQNLGTEWHFIPPSSPNFGGLWEAGVKSIKTHMKKTVGTSLLTFEELTTVLTQIEAVLNSRPLCPMTNNPNEHNFLTPSHFLIGRPLVAPPEKCFEMDKKGPLLRWHHVQATYQKFVKLWKRDYLQNLQSRPKGFSTNIHYAPGNLVLLTEDDTPPTMWPTVIIDEVHPGKDDIVRVATVRTASGKTFKRPVSKLRFLPSNVPLEI